jgi:hypothetical protein
MLPWHKPKPCGEVTSAFERPRRWRKSHQSRGDQRPNPRDRHQPARLLVFAYAPDDLGIQDADLIIQLRQGRRQKPQSRPRRFRQHGLWIINLRIPTIPAVYSDLKPAIIPR